MLIDIGGCCVCLSIEAAAVRYSEMDPNRKDLCAQGVAALFCLTPSTSLVLLLAAKCFTVRCL